MKHLFKSQFRITIIAYLIIVGLATIPIVSFLQKVRLANEKYKQQSGVYQNLKIQDNHFLGNSQKVSCDGNLFFQAGAPVTAIHINKDHLYLSQADNKLVIFDLITSGKPTKFNSPILTDFYIDATDVYGSDFLNDQVVRLIFENEKVVSEKVSPKIGHASALTRDSKGHFYVSGYASGNITKIIGRDNFLFLSDLDKIVGLEINDTNHLLIARYGAKPSLLSIDLNGDKQNTIEFEQEDSFSSITSDSTSFWVAFNHAGESQIGKIIDGKLIESQFLNCPSPLKIAIWQDRLFYTSLVDNDGKIYWINKNLQKNGK